TTSYDRLLAANRAYHVELQPTGEEAPGALDRIGALPQVAEHGRIAFVPATRATNEPTPFAWDISAVARVDRNVGTSFEIPRLIAGRNPDPENTHEATASPDFMRAHGLAVGDEISLQFPTFEELIRLFEGRPPVPTGPVVAFRIVGVWRIPHDVSMQEEAGELLLGPAFYEEFADRIATLSSLLVRLRNGPADVDRFVDEARAIGGELSIVTEADLIASVDRALGVQSTALWALGGAVALGSMLVLGQAVGRWLMLGGDDQPTLRSLGMSKSHLMATQLLPAGLIGAAGAVLAVACAFFLSPVVPLGLAREVDPDLGFVADLPVLGIGVGVVIVLAMFRGWLHGVFSARSLARPEARAKPSGMAEGLSRNGLPPAIVTGIRFAVEPGRGRTAVPVRSVVAGAVLSIVAVVTAFVFGRSMEHMLTTPATYGFNWDLVVFGGENPTVVAEIERALASSSHVGALSRARVAQSSVGRDEILTIAVEPLRGLILPTLIEGRRPASEDEIALATKTMRSSGLSIGNQAILPGSKEACAGREACTVPFTVVGRVAFWGEGSDPDTGAALTEAGQARIAHSDGVTDYLVDTPPGRDPVAVAREIERDLELDATLPQQPVTVKNLARVRSMPVLLAAILGVLALAIVTHALIMTARRRRHDVAVLKTLGFVRRQVRATSMSHAATTIVLALVVGIPIGVALGRWAWMLLAGRLGVEAVPVAPPASIALGAAGVILVAGLVSLAPARVAARARPAEILRTE
ncbi:MAG: FtsX-like permease family protein, partial [Actinomycetota bacterium]